MTDDNGKKKHWCTHFRVVQLVDGLIADRSASNIPDPEALQLSPVEVTWSAARYPVDLKWQSQEDELL